MQLLIQIAIANIFTVCKEKRKTSTTYKQFHEDCKILLTLYVILN